MKPSTKKTVRLATAFTGAAAGALAFAPTAQAGTLQPTVQPGYQARANIDGATIDSIQGGTCTGTNQSHWLHVGWHAYGAWSVFCFGFKGGITLDSTYYMSAFCGGNNHGSIWSTKGRKYHFDEGTTYRHIGAYSLQSVYISGWGGTNKCPLHP